MKIGEQIKAYRKKAKLTQKDLANRINKSEVTIRKYESGMLEPNMNVVKEICKVLDVKIDEFYLEVWEQDVPKLEREVKTFEAIDTLARFFNLDIRVSKLTEEEANELLDEVGSFFKYIDFKLKGQ